MGYFNNIILNTAYYLLRIMDFAILARVVVSWLPISQDNQIIRLIYQITEPVLAPIRNLLQRSAFGRNMMFDFSPVIAIILVSLLEALLRSFFA